ncbi:MAG: hypothetical protein A2908_04705 [Candidatus Staskawiczbacteria bacterium RIFCSPLOWO2_01_FULL_38_12b]|uniref:Uncharacterized protein n=1 Tax=Candidatus Staskawiczbacteria bacterium RIFCSPLOWO2_01_FULL_38_12b TaxID=1802214 RepID=A0A1G2IGX8_9BACT|nr:MAG: hypothetical protein A2908_04705 [Candidatus Staskawiczbacteria bacterium RIFCSPLOWO2_01_FULL_38_12b]
MAKTKIIDLINRISEIARKEKWTKSYDRDLDYFCWTNLNQTKNARLVKISNEVLIYFNPKGLIKGIGVEYLKNNFIEHNPEYKNLTKFFTEKAEGGVFTIPKSKEKEKKVSDEFDSFAKELVREVKVENWENAQSSEMLEKLISTAISN